MVVEETNSGLDRNNDVGMSTGCLDLSDLFKRWILILFIHRNLNKIL